MATSSTSVTISGSARRYATAAFAVAGETGDYDTWQQALDALAYILQQPGAQQLLTSPAVEPEHKRAALERLLPNVTQPTIRNFINILVERDRLGEAPAIAEAFRERVNQARGIITADVTTAVPLDAQLERTVADRLSAFLKHDPQKLHIRSRVDPSIIGGVVARVGDTLIDDSVRGRIERLRRVLATAR